MKRLQKLRAELEKNSLDALMLVGEADRHWATGFDSSDGMVIITKNEQYFFTDSRYIEAAQAACPHYTVERVSTSVGYAEKSLAALGALGTIGFEEELVTCDVYKKWEERFPGRLRPAQKLMQTLRGVKDEGEIELLIKAQRISEAALEAVLPLIVPGMTEKELAAELVYAMLKRGAEKVSFDPIVISGVRTSMPHGVPTASPILPGTFITMDFGCVYGGYCSDMTRTVALGEPTDEMKNVYEVVLRAQLAGVERAVTGTTGAEVHRAAAEVIASAGYGDYFGHGFGHGVGLEIHESPSASPSNPDPLPTGAVISAEPGVYLPGRFGVRIEDVLVVRPEKCENITLAPKELLILSCNK